MYNNNTVSIELHSTAENNNECRRCGARMVREDVRYGIGMMTTWKCMLCGEVIDPVILSNRAKQSLGNDRGRRSASARDHTRPR
jgi:hypothetical protein